MTVEIGNLTFDPQQGKGAFQLHLHHPRDFGDGVDLVRFDKAFNRHFFPQ